MLRILAILLVAAAVPAAPAQMDEGGLSIVLFQPHPSGTFRWERWCEATVRLKNERPTGFEGRVVVDFPTAPKEGATLVYSRPVVLPAQSMVEVNLMVRFPSASARPRGKETLLPVRVRLMRGQTSPAQDTFPCAMQSEEGPPIAWCDVGECTLPYRLKKQARETGKKAAPADSGRRAYAIEVVPPERLPRRSTGFAAYDAVVLSRWDGAHRLDALQAEALETWVRGGGRLLVIAGPHWKELPLPRLEACLPLRPAERYRTSHLPALSGPFGDLGIDEGVDVYDGERAPARILLGDEAQPFLLERRVGLGAVLLLALDVDRVRGADSPGMERLMRRMLAETVRGSGAPVFSSPSRARDVVESLVAVRVLPRRQMALWLGGYVALAAAALAGARLLRRAEYGHLAAAVVAVAVALALHGVSRAMRRGGGEAIERVRAFVAESAPGDSAVRLEGLEGFSPMRELGLAGLMDVFHSLVEPSVGGAARAEVMELTTDDVPGVGAWTVQPNTVRALRLDAHLALKAPPVAWSARLTREGLKVGLASSLEWPMEGVFLKWNRFVVPIGSLKPGEPREVETWKLGDSVGRYVSSNLQGRWVRVEGMLRRMVYPDPHSRQGHGEVLQSIIQQAGAAAMRPVAVGGFTRSSPRLWDKDAGDAAVTVGMWLVRGDEEALEADRDFLLPPGVARLSLGGRSGRISHLGGGDFAGGSEEEILLSFALPGAIRGAALRDARLHGAFESLHFTVKTEVAWATGAAEPSAWKTVEWPASGGVALPDPAPGQDTLWVRLATRRSSGLAPKGGEGGAALLHRWNIRGLDLGASGSRAAAP